MPVTTVSTCAVLCSAAHGDVVTLLSLVPGDISATGHFASPVPQRGIACCQTFELLLLGLLSRIYSRLIDLSSHITQHKFSVACCTAPL